MNTRRLFTGLFILLACLFTFQFEAHAQKSSKKKTLNPGDVTYTIEVEGKEITCLLADGETTPKAIFPNKKDPNSYEEASKKSKAVKKNKRKLKSLKSKLKELKARLSKSQFKKKSTKIKAKIQQAKNLGSPKKLNDFCASPPGDDDDDDDDDIDTPTGVTVLAPLETQVTDSQIKLLLQLAGLGSPASDVQALKTAAITGNIGDVIDAAFALGDPNCDQAAAQNLFDEDPTPGSNGTTTARGMNMAIVYNNLNCNPFRERLLHILETIYTVSGTVFNANNNIQYRRYIFDFLRPIAYSDSKSLTELLSEMTQHEAMLTFLDGAGNIKGRPNENFARELLELYGLGKVVGGLHRSANAADNQTHTETDVIGSSVVYTGWTVFNNTKVFNPSFYDNSGFTVFAGTDHEKFVTTDLEMVQHITTGHPTLIKWSARWLVQEIVFELLGAEASIDPTLMADAELIGADMVATKGYIDVIELYKIILRSKFFHNQANQGGNLLDPHTHLIGVARELGVPFDYTDGGNNVYIGDLNDWITGTGYFRMYSAGLPFHIRHLEQVSFAGAGVWIELRNAIDDMISAFNNSETNQLCGGVNNAIALDENTTAQQAASAILDLFGVKANTAQNAEIIKALTNDGQDTFDGTSDCNRVRVAAGHVASMRAIPTP